MKLDFYSMFKTLEYRKKYKQKKLELQLLENELTEKLYLFIQQISDQDIKKVCINIKRDIHNRRTRKVKKYELLQLLPSEIGSLINEWIDMQNNMQLEKEKLNIIFKNEIRCIRKKIKSFCTVNNEFIEGLLVANFDLYNRTVTLGNISESELYSVYKYASVVPVTSKFEGGFPWQACEALFMKVPLVLSNIDVV